MGGKIARKLSPEECLAGSASIGCHWRVIPRSRTVVVWDPLVLSWGGGIVLCPPEGQFTVQLRATVIKEIISVGPPFPQHRAWGGSGGGGRKNLMSHLALPSSSVCQSLLNPDRSQRTNFYSLQDIPFF